MNDEVDKRLLCIVGRMDSGGAETFLMKIFREIHKKGFIMDFCVSKEGEGFYDKEIIALGGKIFKTVPKSQNILLSFFSIYNIIKNNKYKRVMRISQHSLSALELLAAKLAGANVLVFRSSNTKTMKKGIESLLHKLFRFLPNKVSTIKIAPSTEAAEFMFGKKADVKIIKNGVATESFKFDIKKREKTRKKMNLEGNFVFSNIGRLTYQKNQKFVINIFAEIKEKIPEAKLLIVGNGELESEFKKIVTDLSLQNDVLFLGITREIPDILMASDMLLFPSFYEGLPNVIIEAQAAGLSCLISDTITEEVKITNLVKFIPLTRKDKWIHEAWDYYQKSAKGSPLDRNMQQQIFDSGYDISNSSTNFIKYVFKN